MFNRKTMVVRCAVLVGFAFTLSAIAADNPVRVAGKLTKIDGNKITITTTATNEAKDTVITCDEATKISRDGDPAALKFTDLKVGQSVRAYYNKDTKIALHVHIAKSNS